MRRFRSGRLPGLLLVIGLGVSACASPTATRAGGVMITTDDEVAFPQPFEFAWDVSSGLQQRIDTGEVIFGVFVDRTPLAPGENLLSLSDDDCDRDAACPNAGWLADRGVYATKGSSLVLSGLHDNRTSDGEGAVDRHRAVIVLLDAGGSRVGEDYWTSAFVIERKN